MAGILANSIDVYMAEADTAPSNDVDGFVKSIEIGFAVVHSSAQTTLRWNVLRPTDGTAELVVATDYMTARLRPDIGGDWCVTCLVNGNVSYSIILSVLDAAPTTPVHGQRLVRRHPDNVLTPREGSVMFLSSVTGLASEKLPDTTIRVLGSGGDVSVAGQVLKIAGIPIEGTPTDGQTFRYSAATGKYTFGL